jgi:hypothetical protein
VGAPAVEATAVAVIVPGIVGAMRRVVASVQDQPARRLSS